MRHPGLLVVLVIVLWVVAEPAAGTLGSDGIALATLYAQKYLPWNLRLLCYRVQSYECVSHHAPYDTKMDGLVDTGQNFSQLDIQGM